MGCSEDVTNLWDVDQKAKACFLKPSTSAEHVSGPRRSVKRKIEGKRERDAQDAEVRARREMRGARRPALSLRPVLTSHRQWPFPKKMEFIENGRLKNIWSWREAAGRGSANTTVAQ